MTNPYKTNVVNFVSVILTIGIMIGCIKDPPANPEADIISFNVDSADITSKTVIDQVNNIIQLYLTTEAFDKGIAPVISTSEGATITPASGDSVYPKNGPVTYTVTSQTGINQKTYTIEIVNVGDWSFDFENWLQNASDKYEYPVENDNIEIWSSGNPGVALAGVPQQPDAYPTRSTTDAYSGNKAAELVTIKGTTLSEFIGAHLFAGSLFIGTFNPESALGNPLKATEFGDPYVGLPQSFTGYYKYAPGAVFLDENKNPVPGKTDECSVYAVLFQGPDRLDATNIHTSDKVIATATLPDRTAKSSFTKFDIPFVYKQGWDSTAKNLLITIVASSSKEGDQYRGAIGSKLVVDSLAIIPK